MSKNMTTTEKVDSGSLLTQGQAEGPSDTRRQVEFPVTIFKSGTRKVTLQDFAEGHAIICEWTTFKPTGHGRSQWNRDLIALTPDELHKIVKLVETTPA